MVTATLPHKSGSSENEFDQSPIRRLIVTWQHPITRDVSPIGILGFDGDEYSFAYLKSAHDVDGFGPLLGFPDFDTVYRAAELFQLFAQRAMDPRRPDYERYVTDLGIPLSEATPWEQIARSTGARGSDTLQLFPAPWFRAENWSCFFLVTGIRHLLEKRVTFEGEEREQYTPESLDASLLALKEGDELRVEHETSNKYSETALLVGSIDGRPVGWLPNWLAEEVLELQMNGQLSIFVDKVNPPEAGWHMRVVARMQAACAHDYEFFTGPRWETPA